MSGATQANTIFLLPRSHQFVYDTGDYKKGKVFEVEHAFVNSLQTVEGKTLWIKPQFAAPSGVLAANKAMTEPFWAVRKVEEQVGGGNMMLATLGTSGSMVTLYGADDGVASPLLTQAPVLTNPSRLEAGEELVWACGNKKKRPRVAVKATPAAKKTKAADDDSDNY